MAAAVVLLGVSEPATAGIDGRQDPKGEIVNGRPTAIVVSTPAGDSTAYQSRGGSGSTWTCHYFGTATGGGAGGGDGGIGVDQAVGPISPTDGQYVGLVCRDQGGVVVREDIFFYEPGDPIGGLFAAERAAEMALSQLELPVPAIAMSPPGDQLVGIPTWLWLDGGWAPLSTSATIAGVTSTVTATPTSVVWDLGDGTSVTCAGPGLAYAPNTSPADACTTTFIRSSADLPSGIQHVSATVSFGVGWTASTGEGEDLGNLTAVGGVDVRVVEVQAIIN